MRGKQMELFPLKISQTTVEGIVLEELKELGAYIKYITKESNVVIKFSDPRLGSLRVGNLKGKFTHKWNLISDIDNSYEIFSGGHKAYLFTFGDVYKLIEKIKEYQNAILYGPKQEVRVWQL